MYLYQHAKDDTTGASPSPAKWVFASALFGLCVWLGDKQCLIFMSSKLKTFSVRGWRCCVLLTWFPCTSLPYGVKWETLL